jgi:transcriptional regulator with XRE-family HTH domain
MPESHASRGARRGRRLLADLGAELRATRIGAGLTLAEVAGAAGISAAELSRIERGLAPWLGMLAASKICAIVGLDLAVRAYPDGNPLRDRAHVPMFATFRSLLGKGLRLRAEVPVAGSGLRAWDGTIADTYAEAAVELESRIGDAQALARRVTLKQRDSGIDRVVLVLLDSRTNRLALRLAMPLLETEFPLPDRAIRHALAEGAVPSASGILLLRMERDANLALRKQTTRSG